MVDKTEYQIDVWNRVNSILKKRKVSQVDLVGLCRQQGYNITQPEISKLNSQTSKITLYQAMAFSTALNVSLDYLLKGEERKISLNFPEGNLTVKVDNGAFNGILGRYYTLFHSTVPKEAKWLYGELMLEADTDGNCHAKYRLDTGQKSNNGQAVYKYYTGQAIASKRLPVMYIILGNTQMGELCFIELRYRTFHTRDMECRMGLSLTTASGDAKLPDVHKVLLFRNQINDKALEKIKESLEITADKEYNMVISKEEDDAVFELLERSSKSYIEK